MFLYYDLVFFVFFCIVVAIFLIKNRKKLKVESKILLLYRTKLGIKLIEKVGRGKEKFFFAANYIVITIGYFLMFSSILLLFFLLKNVIKFPEIIKIAKVPPLMPLVPYLPSIFKIEFLPPFYFTYWLLTIAIVAIVHEFAHGIFAKNAGVRIKATGFGFLGPFLAAFVEPEEKKLAKKEEKKQLAVLAAGSFANLLTTFFFLLIMWIFFVSAFEPAGIIFSDYSFNIINSSAIESIGNISTKAGIEQAIKKANFFAFEINNKTLNMTKVVVENKTYYITKEMLEMQFNMQKKEKEKKFLLYYESPAFLSGLKGAILSIDGEKTKSIEKFASVMEKKKPKEIVRIETTQKNYTLILQEHPENRSRAWLGISFAQPKKGILSSIIFALTKWKNPFVYYEASKLSIFIFNLLFWIIVINASVAIINMLPLGIFDGGRFLFVSALAITKKKKKAKKIFKIASSIILFIFFLLMLLWLVFIR